MAETQVYCKQCTKMVPAYRRVADVRYGNTDTTIVYAYRCPVGHNWTEDSAHMTDSGQRYMRAQARAQRQ